MALFIKSVPHHRLCHSRQFQIVLVKEISYVLKVNELFKVPAAFEWVSAAFNQFSFSS
jgi:hypothetical protein